MKNQDGFFITLALYTLALAYLSIDIYLPALPQIQHYFAANISQTQQTLTTFFFGLAIAQILAGPTIEHLGYRKVLIAAFSCFVATSVICTFAHNIETLIITRFFQALCTGTLGVTVRASFVKRFKPEKVTQIFVTYGPFIILSSVIAPTLGGFIVGLSNWRGVFFALSVLGAALAWGMFICFHVPHQKPEKPLSAGFIAESYLTVLKHGRFIKYMVINGMYFGITYSYITEAPFIYNHYGYSAEAIGLTFLPLALSFLVASQINRRLHRVISMNQIVLITAVFIAIGLSLFTLPVILTSSVIPMTIGICFCSFGMGFSSPIAFSKAVTLFTTNTGYASSLLTSIPFIASMLLSLIIHRLTGNSPMLLAAFLAVIAIFCITTYALIRE